MTRRWLLAALSLAAPLAIVAPAKADFAFTFGTVSDMLPNSSQTISVYLTWDGSGTNSLEAPGLLSANTALRYNATGGATLSVANPAGFAFNFAGPAGALGQGFDDTTPQSPAQFATPVGYSHQTKLAAALLGTSLNPAATTAQNSSISNGGNSSSLYIASFTIQSGPLLGDISLRADRRNLNGSSADIVDANAVVLDSLVNQNAASGVINFQVVPEPTSFVLVGLAASGFGMIRRRKFAAGKMLKGEQIATV